MMHGQKNIKKKKYTLRFIFTVEDKHSDMIFPARRHKNSRHTKIKRCGWQSL